MSHQNTSAKTSDPGWGALYKISACAALTVGILLLTAMVSLLTSAPQFGDQNGWLSSLQNNWLIVIFKLHAGFNGVQIDLLSVLDLLDVIILALVATMYLGLYAVLSKTSKPWSLIAALQPFLGLALFFTTKTAGRSGLMGAALVVSFVMLRGNVFKRAIAYTGIVASVLLLAGDFSAGVIPPLTLVATLFAIGYVLLIIWFFLIARRLFQIGSRI